MSETKHRLVLISRGLTHVWFFQENLESKPLARVEDVSARFMNILKFRRKTVCANSPSEPMKTPSIRERLMSYSDLSDALSSNNGTPAKNKRSLSFRGITQSFSTMLRLRRLQQEPKPVTKLENTYKMVPDTGKKFSPDSVSAIVYKTLEDSLSGMDYEHIVGGKLAVTLSAEIKDNIKLLKKPRYRVICQIVITQATGQGLEAASKFLWDDNTDSYSCVTYRNKDVVAVATVFGVYLE